MRRQERGAHPPIHQQTCFHIPYWEPLIESTARREKAQHKLVVVAVGLTYDDLHQGAHALRGWFGHHRQQENVTSQNKNTHHRLHSHPRLLIFPIRLHTKKKKYMWMEKQIAFNSYIKTSIRHECMKGKGNPSPQTGTMLN